MVGQREGDARAGFRAQRGIDARVERGFGDRRACVVQLDCFPGLRHPGYDCRVIDRDRGLADFQGGLGRGALESVFALLVPQQVEKTRIRAHQLPCLA